MWHQAILQTKVKIIQLNLKGLQYNVELNSFSHLGGSIKKTLPIIYENYKARHSIIELAWKNAQANVSLAKVFVTWTVLQPYFILHKFTDVMTDCLLGPRMILDCLQHHWILHYPPGFQQAKSQSLDNLLSQLPSWVAWFGTYNK